MYEDFEEQKCQQELISAVAGDVYCNVCDEELVSSYLISKSIQCLGWLRHPSPCIDLVWLLPSTLSEQLS